MSLRILSRVKDPMAGDPFSILLTESCHANSSATQKLPLSLCAHHGPVRPRVPPQERHDRVFQRHRAPAHIAVRARAAASRSYLSTLTPLISSHRARTPSPITAGPAMTKQYVHRRTPVSVYDAFPPRCRRTRMRATTAAPRNPSAPATAGHTIRTSATEANALDLTSTL